MMRKALCLLSVAMIAGLAFTGEAPAQKWPKHLSVVCGPEGGSGFALLSVWAPIINKASGANLSVQATGGNSVNAIMVHRKQADFGLSTSALVAEGWKGADWTSNLKLTDLRTIAIFQSYVTQYYGRAKKNIRALDDMTGRHVSLGNAGTSTDVWGRRLFSLFNVKPSRISNVAPGQGNDLLKDDLLDIQAVHGSVPHNSIVELQLSDDLIVFGLSKERGEQFMAKYPGLYPFTIPAGTYKKQTEPFHSFSEPVVLVGHKDLPADLVYQVTKATFEKQKDLEAGYKPFRQVKIENAVQSPVLMHPGAHKYYAEKGIKIPDAAIPK